MRCRQHLSATDTQAQQRLRARRVLRRLRLVLLVSAGLLAPPAASRADPPPVAARVIYELAGGPGPVGAVTVWLDYPAGAIPRISDPMVGVDIDLPADGVANPGTIVAAADHGVQVRLGIIDLAGIEDRGRLLTIVFEDVPPAAAADCAGFATTVVDVLDADFTRLPDTDLRCQSVAPACADGLDNDGDGLIDFPADTVCRSAADLSERLDCDDGLDNDGDGLTDKAEDPGCKNAWEATRFEDPECNDGIDNDGDGFVDLADPGCDKAWQDNESPQCNDGLDNDGDSFVDLDDPECASAWADDESVVPPPTGGGCGLLGIEAVILIGLAQGTARRLSGRRRGARNQIDASSRKKSAAQRSCHGTRESAA